MSISTSACRFSMNIMAARYAWRFALGARPVGHPPWLKRLSAGENERDSDFFFFFFGLYQSDDCPGFLITVFNYSFYLQLCITHR